MDIDRSLLYFTGADIPFPAAKIIIHQPNILDISYGFNEQGEEGFFLACEMLNISKENLRTLDEKALEKITNFDLFMMTISDASPLGKEQKERIKILFSLIFPIYTITFSQSEILLKDNENTYSIDGSNFEEFKQIIKEMFCLNGLGKNNLEYDPVGERAKNLANKFRKAHEELAQIRGSGNKISLYMRQASILSIGNHQDLNKILHYTVFQLQDCFRRFELRESFNLIYKAKLAGAKDSKELSNWMGDLYIDENK